jgi:AraC-like DNA-binding protein
VQFDRYFLQLSTTIEDTTLKGPLMSAVQLFIFRELKLILPNLDDILDIIVASEISPSIRRIYGPLAKRGMVFQFELTAESRSTYIHKSGFGDLSNVAPKFIDLLNKELPKYGPFTKRVRRLILSMCNPETPAIDEVAVHFPMSLRSFQRRLSQEGTNFKEIRDTIRQELSAFFEKDMHMQTKEVAYLLGYSESSAYIHARHRWKKQTDLAIDPE